MHEIVDQLSEQAKSTIPLGVEVNEWIKQYNDNFARLIVQECAKVCRDQPNVYALKADRDNCAIAIEQHFGVEE